MLKTNPVNASSAILLAIAGLGLAGCGLTGPLQRPAPIIGEPDPAAAVEPAPAPVIAEVPDPEPRPTVNEFGGDLPSAAPVEEVVEGGLPPLNDGD